MSLLDQINLNHLRIFETVFRERSMTLAAKQLHLTQSGISQHIKALEDTLGVKLFDRYKQKIIATGTANTLYEQCVKGFSDLERTLSVITGKSKQIAGMVKIAMPLEFGNSLILPIASEFLKKHPLLQVRFYFGLSHEITNLVLSGDVDFAYVDEFTRDKRVTVEKVHDEPVDMVASIKYLKGKAKIENKKSFYDELEYIAYVEGEPVLRSWFKHHYKFMPDFNVRAYCGSPTGVLRLVLEDLGVGAVPRHLLKHLGKASEKLQLLPGSGKDLVTPISIAYLTGKSHSHAAFEFSKAVAERMGIV